MFEKFHLFPLFHVKIYIKRGFTAKSIWNVCFHLKPQNSLWQFKMLGLFNFGTFYMCVQLVWILNNIAMLRTPFHIIQWKSEMFRFCAFPYLKVQKGQHFKMLDTKWTQMPKSLLSMNIMTIKSDKSVNCINVEQWTIFSEEGHGSVYKKIFSCLWFSKTLYICFSRYLTLHVLCLYGCQ